jgi:hypothetical protein
MVMHGGGPGLIVPRKRVEGGNGMWIPEGTSTVNWNHDKVKESKDPQGFETEILNPTMERGFSPPLRTRDDSERESDEQEYQDSGDETLNLAQPMPFSLNSFSEPYVQSLEGAKEEVADSELPEEHSNAADDVDISWDELNGLLVSSSILRSNLLFEASFRWTASFCI